MMNFDFLSETDRRVIQLSGYGKPRGFGKKAALLLIDVQNKFIGPDKPIVEAMTAHPLAIGHAAHLAVAQIQNLLEAARRYNLPVFFTVNVLAPDETVFNSFANKRPPYELQGQINSSEEAIYAPLSPKTGEWVLHKRYASAFFGTPLLSFLNALNCDTVLIAGFSTSGCIRACCVDAASYNLHPVVVSDAVADRIEYSHRAALLDLSLKYADVQSSQDILAYMKGMQSNAKEGEKPNGQLE